MSNEMKLLTALCEALGFDVEENIDRQRHHRQLKPSAFVSNIWKLSADNGAFIMDSDGMHKVELISPEITYKLIPTAPTGEER